MTGRYKEGFRELEWRKQRAGADPAFSPRVWLGNPGLAGRTLLIRPELFLGDMIQFCRYALLATAHGARVMLAVPRPLLTVLREPSGVISPSSKKARPRPVRFT